MESTPFISGIGTALPNHYTSQAELGAALRDLWKARGGNLALFDRLQSSLKVDGRHLALPLSEYYELD